MFVQVYFYAVCRGMVRESERERREREWGVVAISVEEEDTIQNASSVRKGEETRFPSNNVRCIGAR